MDYRILGPLEVIDGDRSVVLPRGRGRALLAVMALHAGEVVSADRIIHELWGESPPPTVATALHNLVSVLRKRLEPSRATSEPPTVLQTTPVGYLLAVDRVHVDANRFRQLVKQAAGAPPHAKVAQLRAALALWRGRALADFTYEPFAQGPIVELEELRLSAIEECIDAELTLGHHADVVAELERLCAEHPLRERPRGQLMLALYRCGRQADALKVYAAARRVLVNELGVEPGRELQRLERGVLDQDSSLEVPPLPPPPEHAGGVLELEDTGEIRPWLASGRRPVTVVFVELAVATIGDDGEDPETLRALVRQGYEVVAGVLQHHGGTVEAFIGDVVVAVFGAPIAHEDDPLRASRAALELREAVARTSRQLERERSARLETRVGVNTGEVVVGDAPLASTTVSGPTVRTAARLQQAAGDGEVLVGDATRRLVEPALAFVPAASPTEIGGQVVPVWRLIGAAPGTPLVRNGAEAPFVGRAQELNKLRSAFDRVVRGGRAWRVTVLGEAGIGKSRLAREFAAQIRNDARVLTGRCPSYGDGITFWPLREVIMEVTGEQGPEGVLDMLVGEADRDSVAADVGNVIGMAPGPATGEAILPSIRRFMEALSRRRPLVLVLEDLHWAQPMLLDLIEYVGRSTKGPVLLLCLARPELLEARPTWRGDQDGVERVDLRPLASDESERFVADRLGNRRLPAEITHQVLQAAQGNPLFLEQLLATFRSDEELAIPPSIQALLAARLDRLGPGERDLLRCASVAGIDFSIEALAALVPEEARPFLERHIESLRGKELIARSEKSLLGEPAFTFRHVLIQLAASRSMTRQARSELHERFARWLEARGSGRSAEFEEVVGYHLEQAHVERRTIGVLDDHTRALAEGAGERLGRAGLRAYERYDMAAAGNLLSRAKSLLRLGHPDRREVLRKLAAAHQQLGRLADSDTVLAELLEEVADGDPRVQRAIRLERIRIRLFMGPDPTPLASIARDAEDSLVTPDASPDELAQACHVLALVHLRAGRLAEMEEIARWGLANADRSGNPRDELAARWSLAWAVEGGSTPVPEAIGMCERLARWRGREHPGVLCELGGLRAMRGEFDEARELATRGRRLLEEWMHARSPLVFTARATARIHILAGDHADAEFHLRAGLETALEMGLREQIAEFAARLSLLLSVQGASADAEHLATMCSEQAPVESVAAQALGRAAMARVFLVRKEVDTAERLAREVVALLRPEMLNLRGEMLAELAEVLFVSGQDAAGHAACGEAVELYARKGNLIDAARARSLLERRPLA